MALSTGRMWFGGVALSGLILLASMPGTAMAQTALTRPTLKAVASTQVPVSYAQMIRTKLHWTPTNLDSSIQTGKTSKKVKVAASAPAKKLVKVTKEVPEKIASVQTQQTQQTQQVSRGGSGGTSAVSRALSLQGIPYVFGGTTRSGFDCSGFTRYVYAASGISLPRTSYAQYNFGTPVNRGQLQPGDLVFFSTYTKGASHVGIYIGGGRFVHASNSGVRVTSLNENYYATRFLGARRP